MDLGEISVLCDYFVIASAPTRVQIRHILRGVEEKLAEAGVPRQRVEGSQQAAWVLMDYGTVVVHLFLQQERDFYDLEGLWNEAPVIYRGSTAAARRG